MNKEFVFSMNYFTLVQLFLYCEASIILSIRLPSSDYQIVVTRMRNRGASKLAYGYSAMCNDIAVC